MGKRGPHPLVAVLLSAVWPGLGHWGHRNRRAAALSAAALVVAVCVFVLFPIRDWRDLLDLAVSKDSLWLLIVSALCLLLLRAAVACDAYRASRRARSAHHAPSNTRRVGTLATLTVLAALIAAPHMIVVHLAATQLTLLSEVFTAVDTQTARPTPLPARRSGAASTRAEQRIRRDSTPVPSVTQPPVSVDSDDRAATGSPASPRSTQAVVSGSEHEPHAATTATDPPETTSQPLGSDEDEDADLAPSTSVPPSTTSEPTSQPAEDAPTERLTVALLGSDGGYRRTGVRTDTIIVLSIDVSTGDAAAFSIPRNWQFVTFPDGTEAASRWPDGYPRIVNEIYSLGLRHPDAFPEAEDKAGSAIKLALAQLTGIDIHFYVMADMVGFVEVIDLFGGILLQVNEFIDDRIAPVAADGPPISIKVEPGYHHFDGLTALGYVRSRAHSSDYWRMARQRCVVGALIDQVAPVDALTKFGRLRDIISEHVTTDIPLNRLEGFIADASMLDTSRIVTVNFIPPQYPSGHAPIRQVRDAVARALEGSSNTANVYLADACQ